MLSLFITIGIIGIILGAMTTFFAGLMVRETNIGAIFFILIAMLFFSFSSYAMYISGIQSTLCR